MRTSSQILSNLTSFATDDWKFERPSNKYVLGDVINIQASVMEYKHIPLKVLVDHCVATAETETSSDLRYFFIKNHGWVFLIWSIKITGDEVLGVLIVISVQVSR